MGVPGTSGSARERLGASRARIRCFLSRDRGFGGVDRMACLQGILVQANVLPGAANSMEASRIDFQLVESRSRFLRPAQPDIAPEREQFMSCYAQGEEGVARLAHRLKAGELTPALRRSADGAQLIAPTTSRSLPDDCQAGARSGESACEMCAHASHPLDRIVRGGMRWCALAMVVFHPPPCLGCARE